MDELFLEDYSSVTFSSCPSPVTITLPDDVVVALYDHPIKEFFINLILGHSELLVFVLVSCVVVSTLIALSHR